MTASAWDERVCPHCGSDISDKDLAQIEEQASVTEMGRASLHHPGGAWNLSCGHLVESWVDRITAPAGGFKFKLVDLES